MQTLVIVLMIVGPIMMLTGLAIQWRIWNYLPNLVWYDPKTRTKLIVGFINDQTQVPLVMIISECFSEEGDFEWAYCLWSSTNVKLWITKNLRAVRQRLAWSPKKAAQ